MHPQPRPLTNGGTVLKESDDPILVGVTFDSKMTFEKHLRLVSREASQRLCILTNAWRVLHDRSLLGRCFRSFVLHVLEYCSTVWCSAADTYRILLDRAVSGAQFLTGCVFECDIAHRRSVQYQYCVCCIRSGVIRCPLLMVLFLISMCQCDVLVEHRYTYAPPRCRTSHYRRTFIPLSVSLWNNLFDPVFDGVGVAGFMSRANAFLLA